MYPAAHPAAVARTQAERAHAPNGGHRRRLTASCYNAGTSTTRITASRGPTGAYDLSTGANFALFPLLPFEQQQISDGMASEVPECQPGRGTCDPSFELYQLPPVMFTSSHDASSMQRYADLCSAVGLRPVVSGKDDWGAPEWCAPWNCLQTPDYSDEFLPQLVVATEQGQASAWAAYSESLRGVALVAFSATADRVNMPYRTKSGLMNTVGGAASDTGWDRLLSPLCGRDVPRNTLGGR